jgi:hypothetical protein
MMALQHPATLQFKPKTFLQLQGWLSRRLTPFLHMDDLLNVNFVLVYTLSNQLRLFGAFEDIVRSFDRFFSDGGSPTVMANTSTTTGDAEEGLRQRVRRYGQLSDVWSIDQATALLPSFLFELAAHLLAQDLSNLPLPAKIPFHALMDIPPVFRNDGEPSSACHIRKMTTLEFFSGTCKGYYSYVGHGNASARWFDPPMRNIQIVARTPSEEMRKSEKIKTVIDRESRGVDAHGEFSLQGQVLVDGSVRIAKRYIVHDTLWSWLGQITPFGIVGTWEGCDRFGGYFWIWKEEWC